MPAGRPRKYNSPEELEEKINNYFDYCDTEKREWTDKKGNLHIDYKPYTVSGLCLYLDITRETLNQYENNEQYKDQFSDAIKKAKKRIENFVEEHSLTGELNPVVSIFNLKNNFGWVDKQEIETKGTNIIKIEPPEFDK